MQIHELNKKPAKINETQVNEVDLVGPNSVFNVGKQVLKNPSALASNSAMGTAKQQAYAQHAQQSAAGLISQGYKVGNSANGMTFAQQLSKVMSDPAIQQQVKNISSQWDSQSAVLKKAQLAKTMSEASVAQFDPRELANDPKYANVLKALQAKGVDPTKDVDLEKKLSSWKLEFDTWSKSKLRVVGVNVDSIRQNPQVSTALNKALSEVAVAAQSGNPKLEKEAVEAYLYAAIAGNMVQRQTATTRQPVAKSQSVAGAQTDQEILRQANVPLTAAQLQELGKAVRQDLNGDTVIRDTGSELLNALARVAGLQIGS